MFKWKKFELESPLILLNKFNVVENKIDILNSKFEAITFLDGCCECKKRESKIYEMLVNYFESKFNLIPVENNEKDNLDLLSFKNDLFLELKNICTLSINDNESIKEIIKEILYNQKENFKQITHKTDLYNLKNDLQHSIIGESNKKFDELNIFLQGIDTKVDGFYFENELIKHQLTLEEEIRKFNDDIDSLKIIVHNTTSEIDKILNLFNYENESILI